MNAKHTPGPWRILVDDDGNQLSGRPSVSATEEMDCAIVHWDGFKQTYWQSARGEKEMHANARLIAAAPDLLEALKLALQALEAIGDEMTVGERYTNAGQYLLDSLNPARDAIAKAEGSNT